MKKKAVIVGLVLLAAAGLVLAARRRESVEEFSPDTSGDVVNLVPFGGDMVAWFSEIEAAVQQNFEEIAENNMPLPTPAYMPTQIAAMQSAIAQAEGTAGQPDPYRVCFAYRHTIQSFADHPAITGEWRGEKLSDDMCRGAGFGPGCVSTAAGKYQITKPTWTRIKKKLSLPDFGPASQDAAAAELLRERGSIARLEVGDFVGAVAAARKEWASLPGAGYGQGERSISWLTAKFTDAGGVVA